MKFRKKEINLNNSTRFLGGLVISLFILFFSFTSNTFAAATDRYWVGGANASINTTDSWSLSAGGSKGASIPTTTNAVFFTSDVVTNATIDVNWSVLGISIASGYSGIITQNATIVVTVGASNYSQAGGTWTATTGTFDDNGTFTLSGGTFTPPTTANTYASNFTISGTGNYNIGAAVITTFDGSGNSTVTKSGTVGGIVSINKSTGANVFTVALNTTINLGNSATSTLSTNGGGSLVNNGTILVGTGTWTVTAGISSYFGSFVNNGTVTSSGSDWVFNYSNFTNNANAIITYSGATISVPYNFTQNGTFILTGKTVTFNGTVSSTVSVAAPGILGGTVVISKTTGANTFTVAAGTTINLGNSPTSTFSTNGGGSLVNNGTILVGTGTWTVNAGISSNYGTFTNNGTITSSGSDWIFNYGKFINSVGATVTYTGATMSLGWDFTQNGTFNLASTTVTFNAGVNSILTTATANFGGSITLNKTAANTLTLANNVTVQNFTLTQGTLANVAKILTINGNLIVTPAAQTYFGGTSLSVVMSGSAEQNITITSGTVITPLSINKSAGKVSLLTDYIGSGAGGTMAITLGTLYLNGKNLNATTTVANGGELQLQGAEYFTTPTLSAGSTVTYVGDNDGAADTYYVNSLLPFYNLKINAPDSALDTFIPSSGLMGGLVGYWKFNESGSITASDYRVSGLNGTKVNFSAPAYGSSTSDTHITFTNPYSLSFATNKYIDVPASTTFDTQRLTISAWVYATNFNQQGFIFEKGNVNTQYSLWFDGSSNIKFRTVNSGNTLDDKTVAISATNLTNSAWNNVVAVYDGSNKIIYVNGVASTPSAYTQILKTGLGTAERIGAYGGANQLYYFNGKMDDLRVYNYALSSSEISTLSQKDNTSTSTLSILGTLTISGGIFNISSPLTIAGDLTQTGGTFTAASSDLVLNGASQAITLTGATTVASFNKTSSATTDTLTFGSTGSLVITGATTLQGTADHVLSLRSANPGSQWSFNPQGTRTLAYLNVMDSNNVNATVINSQDYTGLVDGGHNTGWTFGNPPPTLSSVSSLPTPAYVGSSITLTATGTNFVNHVTVINFGSKTLSTTWVNATTITAVFSPVTAGNFNITVTTPSCVGGSCTTGPQIFTVNSILSIISISPTSVNVGAGNTTLTVNGTLLGLDSKVYLGTNQFTPDYINPNGQNLTVTIPASYFLSAATYGVTITSSGHTSNAQPFTVGPIGGGAFDYSKTFYGSASLRK